MRLVGVNVIIDFFFVFVSLYVGDLYSAISIWGSSELRFFTLSLTRRGLTRGCSASVLIGNGDMNLLPRAGEALFRLAART